MNPIDTAAAISGCFLLVSVAGTVIVAIAGFRTTRAVTTTTVEAGTGDTVRALNAARDDRLWEKRAATYEETIAYLLFREHQRDSRSWLHIMGRDIDKVMRFSFGGYRPPGWGEIQGRLVAYASDPVVAAYEESRKAENEAFFVFDVWKSVYNRMLKEKPELESGADDPEQVKAQKRLHTVEKKAKEKDQALIQLMRSELHGKPSF